MVAWQGSEFMTDEMFLISYHLSFGRSCKWKEKFLENLHSFIQISYYSAVTTVKLHYLSLT